MRGARAQSAGIGGEGSFEVKRAARRINLASIARQIAATVRAENATPAVLVGHSLGGAIVGHVPLVDAEVVRALVIVDSGIGPLWTDEEIAQVSAGLAKDREATLHDW